MHVGKQGNGQGAAEFRIGNGRQRSPDLPRKTASCGSLNTSSVCNEATLDGQLIRGLQELAAQQEQIFDQLQTLRETCHRGYTDHKQNVELVRQDIAALSAVVKEGKQASGRRNSFASVASNQLEEGHFQVARGQPMRTLFGAEGVQVVGLDAREPRVAGDGTASSGLRTERDSNLRRSPRPPAFSITITDVGSEELHSGREVVHKVHTRDSGPDSDEAAVDKRASLGCESRVSERRDSFSMDKQWARQQTPTSPTLATQLTPNRFGSLGVPSPANAIIQSRAGRGHEWPEGLQLRPELARSDDAEGLFFSNSSFSNSKESFSVRSRSSAVVMLEDIPGDDRCCALDPTSTTMLFVDLMGFIALMHDIIVTPYVLAFDLPVRGGLNILAWIAGLYWLFNCVLSFFVGFYQKGELNMKPRDIAKHYAKNWLLPDLILLISDWSTIIVQSLDVIPENEADRMLLRCAKLSRFLKIFRLIRLFMLLEKMSSLSLSRSALVLVQVIRISFSILVYNHFVCCLWCFIGRSGPSDTGSRWMDYPAGGRSSELGDQALADVADNQARYIAAFHWTIAQMSPGPIDIVASNSFERVFNTIILIVGLLFGSMIISLLSGHIMQLIVLRRDQTKTLDMLRRFLRQSSIKPSLAVRIQRQVIEHMSETVPIGIEDVPAFNLLSSALHKELLHEVRLPYLLKHGAFKLCSEVDITLAQFACEEAVQLDFLPATDELFLPGELGKAMYMNVKGKMCYTQEPGTSHVHRTTINEVTEGTWFSEAALWTNWFHVGRMETTTSCQCFKVKAQELMDIIKSKRKPACNMLRHYGRNYHMRVVSAVPPHAPWPTDLNVPYASPTDLLSQNVGLNLLKSAMDKGELEISADDVTHLENELRSDRCAIHKTEDGVLERIVAVVALRLHRQDGRVLVKLGTWSRRGGVKARVELPGRKRAIGELPRKKLKRILDEDLERYAGEVELDMPTEADGLCQVTHEERKRYGMPTTYHRTVHFASLKRDDCEENLPRATAGPDTPSSLLFVDRLPEVYMLKRPEGKVNVTFYAWILPDEMEQFEKLELCDDGIQRWLETLDVQCDSI